MEGVKIVESAISEIEEYEKEKEKLKEKLKEKIEKINENIKININLINKYCKHEYINNKCKYCSLPSIS
jgi:translation elongation factor EF-Ts